MLFERCLAVSSPLHDLPFQLLKVIHIHIKGLQDSLKPQQIGYEVRELECHCCQ